MTLRPLSVAAALVLAVTLAAFAVDSTPLFFMGDSGAYITAAIGNGSPFDRSFTYALLIRWLAVWPGTFSTLVLAQVLAGAVTAVSLAFILLRFFQVQPGIAIAAAVACAVEPLQIIHERLVLTEAFAQMLFAMYLLLAVGYVCRQELRTMLLASLAGILLVSLRVVYLPLVLGNAVLLPCLAFTIFPARQQLTDRARRYALHLVVSVLGIFCLHAGYRHVLGAIEPADYLHADGFFLASAWAPVLKPEDATDPRAARVVEQLLSGGQYPLGDRFVREAHRWQPGGLVDELVLSFNGDKDTASRAAKDMALRSLRRDPFAVAQLTAKTYKDYWTSVPTHRYRLGVEQGSKLALPAEFLDLVRTHFGLDASKLAETMTPSKRYHLAGWPWYALLLLSPLVSLLAVLVSHPGGRGGAIVVFLNTSILLTVTCAGSQFPFWRYLYPMAFITVLALAVIADAIWRTVDQAWRGWRSPGDERGSQRHRESGSIRSVQRPPFDWTRAYPTERMARASDLESMAYRTLTYECFLSSVRLSHDRIGFAHVQPASPAGVGAARPT